MARIVRTDRELELPRVDARLRAASHDLVLLAEGVSEGTLERCFEILEGRPVLVKSPDPRLRGQASARYTGPR